MPFARFARSARLLLALALAGCVQAGPPADSIDSEGHAGQLAQAPATFEVSSPVVVEGPNARGPEAEVADGVDLRPAASADELAEPAEPPEAHAHGAWPEVGGGAHLGEEYPLAISEAEPDDRMWSDVNVSDAPAAPEAHAPGVGVASQALTLAATTVHNRSHSIGGVPHEPTLSLGPAQMVIATRGAVTILSKANRLLYRDSASSFFAAVRDSSYELFDCRAVYAPSQKRHVVLCLQNWDPVNSDACSLTDLNCRGQIYLAVSKNAYPNGPADFYMWRSTNVDSDNNASTRNDGDYPFLGVTNDMLIVSMLMREGTGSSSWRWIDTVRVFSMADLAAGAGFGTLRQWGWWGTNFMHNNERIAGVTPAIHWGASGTAYMLSRRPGVADGLLLWTISNPFSTSRSLTVQTVTGWQNQNPPCGASQTPATQPWFCTEPQADNDTGDGIAPSRVISHHDGRLYSPTFRNNRLWFVRDQVANVSGVNRAVVRFGVIDTTNRSVLADNNLFLAGFGYGYGGVTATSTNDALIGFIKTGAGIFPNVRAGMLDRNNVWQSSISVRAASYPFVWGPNTPYDVGVSIAAEPSEDAAWLVTQTPNSAPGSASDWNVGLVLAKVGGAAKYDLTVPMYGSHAPVAITDVASASRGSSLSVNVRVENFGDAASTAQTVKLYLSKDTTINSSDTLVGSGTIAALASAAWGSVTITGTVPSTMSTGTYYLGAVIQANASEYDTGNNSQANDTTTTIR